MSVSTTANFDPILSELLSKIGQNQFVGPRILPFRQVGTENGKYPVFSADQFDNDASAKRAPGSKFARLDTDYDQASYDCEQYALEHALPDEDANEAAENGISDIRGALGQKLQRNLMVGHELRVASLMASAGFNTTGGTSVFSDNTNARPIEDIQRAVEKLNGNGFFGNLKLMIESSLYNEMINTDDIRNIFNGAGIYSDNRVLLDALGVDEIVILPSRYNSAAKGKAAVRSKIWSTTEIYVGQVVGGDFSAGGFGRTLAYSPNGGEFTAETYRDEPIKSDVLRVYNSVDEVVINVNACERIDTV